jgi:hypothetical protein
MRLHPRKNIWKKQTFLSADFADDADFKARWVVVIGEIREICGKDVDLISPPKKAGCESDYNLTAEWSELITNALRSTSDKPR